MDKVYMVELGDEHRWGFLQICFKIKDAFKIKNHYNDMGYSIRISIHDGNGTATYHYFEVSDDL